MTLLECVLRKGIGVQVVGPDLKAGEIFKITMVLQQDPVIDELAFLGELQNGVDILFWDKSDKWEIFR